MINQETIQKILDATQIVDVIGEFVSLRRRGANYVACCPFHDEKTPSFSVSPSKGIFKCFGCGKGGDAVHFIMEHEHLSYPEALKWLAAKYHIDVVEKEETAEEIASRMKSESMMLVNEFAAKYFARTLLDTPEGRAVGLSYFREKRRLREDTIRRFGLGYSPAKRDSFAKEAIANGYKPEFLTATGLCIEKENGGGLYDRFFERVIFPIHSLSGRVIAFGGRTLKADKTIAKYVNSPESEIYLKRRSLYGIYFAKGEISKKDKCLLVEGYLDVISMHQAGITNVVASSGTSLTTEQIRLIRRFTSNITILYDGDSAGIKASLRGIDLVLEEGMNVKIVLIPDGDDPDSFSMKHTKEEVEEFISGHEQDFIDFKASLLLEEAGDDPRKRAGLINSISTSIAVIPDAIARSLYAERCAAMFGIEPDLVFERVRTLREEKKARESTKAQSPAMSRTVQETKAEETRHEGRQGETYGEDGLINDRFFAPCEKEIAYYLVKFGDEKLKFPPGSVEYDPENPDYTVTVAEYIKNSMSEDGLEMRNRLYSEIYDEYFRNAPVYGKEIISYFLHHPNENIAEETLDYVYDRHVITIKEFADTVPDETATLSETVPKLMCIYKSKVVDAMLREITEEIASAQKENDREKIEGLTGKFMRISGLKNYYSKLLKRLTI